jgi:uncharacterized protein (TIGR02001 family)
MQRVFAIVLVALFPAATSAAELTGYATLTSDFVRRGVSQSYTDPAVQLGADLAFQTGIIAGAWASTVDNRSQSGKQHDVELNVYAGYGQDAGDRWRLSGFVIAYTYPGMETPFDYDYVEFLGSANYDDRFWIEFAYAPDYYGTGDPAWNAELLAEWPLVGPWRFSAGLGRFDLGRVVDTDYVYWQAGITGDVGVASLDLRFHDTNRVVPFFSSPDTARERIVLTLTIPF